MKYTQREKNDFDLAMKLAVVTKKTIGYRIHENSLVLYSTKSSKAILLPYEMNLGEITEFSWGWLNKVIPENKQPDHDGSNGKGFKIFNESWGHVFGEWEAYIAIKPIWAMYGK